MGSATIAYPVTKAVGKEIVESTGSFVEKRRTFFYNNKERQYLLIFPAGYAQNTADWPLIFFLHGSSLRGEDLNKVKEYGPTWVAEQRAAFCCSFAAVPGRRGLERRSRRINSLIK